MLNFQENLQTEWKQLREGIEEKEGAHEKIDKVLAKKEEKEKELQVKIEQHEEQLNKLKEQGQKLGEVLNKRMKEVSENGFVRYQDLFRF